MPQKSANSKGFQSKTGATGFNSLSNQGKTESATPEQIARAREIVNSLRRCSTVEQWALAESVALAAIAWTTERAANWLNDQTLDSDEYDLKLDMLALSLRQGSHLP